MHAQQLTEKSHGEVQTSSLYACSSCSRNWQSRICGLLILSREPFCAAGDWHVSSQCRPPSCSMSSTIHTSEASGRAPRSWCHRLTTRRSGISFLTLLPKHQSPTAAVTCLNAKRRARTIATCRTTWCLGMTKAGHAERPIRRHRSTSRTKARQDVFARIGGPK